MPQDKNPPFCPPFFRLWKIGSKSEEKYLIFKFFKIEGIKGTNRQRAVSIFLRFRKEFLLASKSKHKYLFNRYEEIFYFYP